MTSSPSSAAVGAGAPPRVPAPLGGTALLALNLMLARPDEMHLTTKTEWPQVFGELRACGLDILSERQEDGYWLHAVRPASYELARALAKETSECR